MTDFRLLNGNKKVTLIEMFNGHAIMISPDDRVEFESLDECKKHVSGAGFEVNISHLFGSSIRREI